MTLITHNAVRRVNLVSSEAVSYTHKNKKHKIQVKIHVSISYKTSEIGKAGESPYGSSANKWA